MNDNIYDEIQAERAYQDNKWGTTFDDQNTVNDWMAYINIYGAKATDMKATPETQRLNMMKVAALAVAACQAFDRNDGFAPRHYDVQENDEQGFEDNVTVIDLGVFSIGEILNMLGNLNGGDVPQVDDSEDKKAAPAAWPFPTSADRPE